MKFISNEKLWEKMKDVPKEINILSREFQTLLRRQQVPCPKTKLLFKNKEIIAETGEEKLPAVPTSEDGTSIDKEVRLRKEEIRKIDFRDKVVRYLNLCNL